jgi:hypothetical protein
MIEIPDALMPRRFAMTVADEFLESDERYAAAFGKGDLAMPPQRGHAPRPDGEG